MAWLKLTHLDGRRAILNADQISEISERSDSPHLGIWYGGRLDFFRESLEDIAAMIDKAVWSDRAMQCACAIMSNEHANGLTSEQVWARAVRFAAMDPEQPTT